MTVYESDEDQTTFETLIVESDKENKKESKRDRSREERENRTNLGSISKLEEEIGIESRKKRGRIKRKKRRVV